jgi:tetratricopeptide (TPR) repeat protein
MSLRGKSRRRLLILLSVVVGLGMVGGLTWFIRLSVLRREAIRSRDEGMVAYKAGDYQSSLKELGVYLGRFPTDVDVLLPYAKSRLNVEDSQHSNVGQAILLYQRVLQLRPADLEAQSQLLDLYNSVGHNAEAISTADAIIARPAVSKTDLAHAYLVKANAQMRMQKLDDAQMTVRKWTEVAPTDLNARVIELELVMKKSDARHARDYADQLAAAHPNDDRFQLLRSVAAAVAGDKAAATALVRPLLGRPLIDATYTRFLTRQLDDLDMYSEAFDVLQSAAKSLTDDDIQHLWHLRLFETNRFAMLIDQTAGLDPSALGTDPEPIALRALAMYRVNRAGDAKTVIAQLARRGESDSRAKVWSTALTAITVGQGADSAKSIELIRDALIPNQQNPILVYELAEAYSRAGAHDKAITMWQNVTRIAPEWAAPWVRLSQAMIGAGRQTDALTAAQAAQIRAPQDQDAAFALLLASAANLPVGASPQNAAVVAQINGFCKRFPENPDALPLKVRVLAQAGRRDDAISTIASSLKLNPLPRESALLSMAQTSITFGLGQEQACWQASESAYGMTPNLAFARASWLHDHQQAPAALAMVDSDTSKHPGDKVWESMRADYLDQVGDPRAKAEWVRLGDSYPADVQLQWGAVSSRSVQSDHDFIGRTIDRLVSLLGDDSVALRMLRARWYLNGSAGDNDTTEAMLLLSQVSRNAPDMLAPRLLLATCYMRMKNVGAALDQLAAASDAQPNLATLAVEVARLFQAHGDVARSRQYIDRTCRSPRATTRDLRQAASLMALQGDYKNALALLEKVYSSQKQLPPDIVLASLYRQLGQPDKTALICVELLKKPDPESVSFCADFYASRGNTSDARDALAKLDGLKLQPGQKEVILGDFASHYGTADETLKDYRAAAAVAPKEPAVWRRLVGYSISAGRFDDAIDAAGQAAQNIPATPSFETISKNAAVIRKSQDIAGGRQLVMSIGSDPAGNAAVIDAITLLVAAKENGDPPAKTVVQLRQLADHNPKILAIQTVTLQAYIESDEMDDAIQMATRTAEHFPSAVEPLRVETLVLNKAGRFQDVIETAKEWRRHDSNDAIDPDMAIASAEMQLGDVNAANQQIQPYLDRAMKDPDRFTSVFLLRAQGLLASHHPEEAESLLIPMLEKYPGIRAVWMRLAGKSVEDLPRAQAWLTRVTAYTSATPNEQLYLGEAWTLVGQRFASDVCSRTGRDIIERVTKSPDAPEQAFFRLGVACDQVNDLPASEAAYSRAVEMDPKDSAALNNLAAMMVRTHGDLHQAAGFVAQAIDLEPKRAAFLDTKASIQAAQKDIAGATVSLRAAQQLDSVALEWHVNLLEIFIKAGKQDLAKAELQEIDRRMPTFATPLPPVQERYERLRSEIR